MVVLWCWWCYCGGVVVMVLLWWWWCCCGGGGVIVVVSIVLLWCQPTGRVDTLVVEHRGLFDGHAKVGVGGDVRPKQL